MTDNICRKRGPTRLFCGFRVKRVVSMAMTNCFRKIIFVYFLNSAFICWLFCPTFKPNNLLSPVKEPVIFQQVKMNIDTFLVAIYCLL